MSFQSRLARIVEERTGIVLRFDTTFGPVESLLRNRIAALGLSEPSDYVALLERCSLDDDEWRALIAAMTNGQTAFFRDRAQMTILGDALVELASKRSGPIQVWSAGCSTGEEVYTVRAIAHQRGVPVEILGTDLDAVALSRASVGRYGAWSLRRFDESARAGLVVERAGSYEVTDVLRPNVRFSKHNLVEHDRHPAPPAPAIGWDIILCRNVLIYFNQERAEQVLSSLGRRLAQDGWLFVGPADALRLRVGELVAVRVGGRTVLRRLGDEPRLPRGSIPPPRGALCSIVDPGFDVRPEDPASFDAAVDRLRRGSLDDAGRVLVRVLEDGEDVRARITLGNIHLARHRFEKAAEEYARAHDDASLLAEVHFFQALLNKKTGQLEAAADASRRALFLDPDFWPALCIRASVAMRQADGDRVARDIHHLTELVGRARQAPILGPESLLVSSIEGMPGLVPTLDEAEQLCRHHLGR